MRIAFAVTSPVSANLFLMGVARFLESHGHEIYIISGGKVSDIQVPQHSNIQVATLKMERQPALFKDIISFCRLFVLIRNIRPEIIVYATPKVSLLASLSSFLLHIPLRIYALWGFRYETVGGLYKFILQSFEKLIGALSTSVIPNSFSLAKKAIDSSIVPERKIAVLGSGSSHGVDTKKFSKNAQFGPIDPATSQFVKSGLGMTVGFIGRLHPDKGIDQLMDAAQAVVSRGIPLRLLIIGPNEGLDLMNKWKGIDFHLVGEVGDVRPYIDVMDLLVLMSLREGFPNVVLEAGAMEVPSIVSDATGCVDAVIDGETGIIVPVGDVGMLTNVLIELTNDTSKRIRLGQNAKQRIMKEFTQQMVFENIGNYLTEQR